MKLTKTILLLSVLVTASSVSACSTNNNNSAASPSSPAETHPQTTGTGEEEGLEPEPGAKLIIWEGKDEKPFIDAIAQKFTAKYNIPVEFQEVPPTEQRKKLKTDGPAGLGADILIMPHNTLGDAVASGIILPNDFYAEETQAGYPKEIVDAVSLDGMIYGYPRNVETYLLYYNKTLVNQKDLESWDSIISFAKGYNDVANNKFGFMWQVTDFYYNYSWIASNGGYVFGANGTDPKDIGLNNDGAIEGMKFYQSLREALPINGVDATADVKTNLFQTGKLPINMDGVSQLGNFTEEKLGFEVGAVPLPPLPNGKSMISFAGVKAYYVSSFSKFPNAAKLFIHYATTEEAALENFKLTGIIPTRNGMDTVPEITSNEIVKAFTNQIKNSQPMPNVLPATQIWGPSTAALELIWNGGDVKEILDKSVEDIKAGIEQQAKK
ncbi:sugar ABC transporter substrate-binding protein [Paenibacillus donghaensis]|uniref:Maltose ABC transporter substrate-binding protein n=1 Tax=Paenibacillus donghaensis TaxID=414771 RepID=A0A2Z2KYW3_9BACL|nr:maltose ABC transporter substrate-binding protein [Paenibacillus donghaensis]ASA25888.1 maltose ABC transporter substrate-binding protein [Paenibacillus donghaensis]